MLYATGYRFDFGKGGSNFFLSRANLISTGGLYVSAERTGAEIYVDNELVRETRVFRTAFYAQNLDPGTHRVHVQRPGSHTWVKELPVYPHLVTEAQAFNLPLVPAARIITEWQTVDGATVIPFGARVYATTTQALLFATTTATTTFAVSGEFSAREALFIVPTTTPEVPSALLRGTRGATTTAATTTVPVATTTKEQNGVRLFERGDDVYAAWVGPREGMPYYYCAAAFEPLGTSTGPLLDEPETVSKLTDVLAASPIESPVLDNPVQEVPEEAECEPEIRLDRKWQDVHYFDFFPGSTDFAILVLERGVYAVEIDPRSWQNVQPIMEGDDLEMRVDGGRVYVKDSNIIYEMILE